MIVIDKPMLEEYLTSYLREHYEYIAIRNGCELGVEVGASVILEEQPFVLSSGEKMYCVKSKNGSVQTIQSEGVLFDGSTKDDTTNSFLNNIEGEQVKLFEVVEEEYEAVVIKTRLAFKD